MCIHSIRLIFLTNPSHTLPSLLHARETAGFQVDSCHPTITKRNRQSNYDDNSLGPWLAFQTTCTHCLNIMRVCHLVQLRNTSPCSNVLTSARLLNFWASKKSRITLCFVRVTFSSVSLSCSKLQRPTTLKSQLNVKAARQTSAPLLARSRTCRSNTHWTPAKLCQTSNAFAPTMPNSRCLQTRTRNIRISSNLAQENLQLMSPFVCKMRTFLSSAPARLAAFSTTRADQITKNC